MFVTLTQKLDGSRISININNICAVREDGTNLITSEPFCTIFTNNGSFIVKENYNDAMKLISSCIKMDHLRKEN